MKMPDDLKKSVADALEQKLAPTAGSGRLSRIAILAAVTAVAAGLGLFRVYVLGNGFFAGSRPLAFIVGTGLGWVLVAAIDTWLAFGGRTMLGRPRGVLLAGALLVPIALLGWMLLWNALFPETLQSCPDRPGRLCFDATIALAGLPLLGLILLRRGTDPVHGGASGAAWGAGLGAWAGLAIDLSCGCTDPAHVLKGHILPVAVLAFTGALLGRWLLTMRRAKP